MITPYANRMWNYVITCGVWQPALSVYLYNSLLQTQQIYFCKYYTEDNVFRLYLLTVISLLPYQRTYTGRHHSSWQG
jgi:hypothetical protein